MPSGRVGSSPTPGTVSAYDEDDDWVGEPPEGRYSRDRAKPDFWADKKPVSFVAAGIAIVVLVLVLVALLG